MIFMHKAKFRRGVLFQTERRKVQRQVVQSILLCGLLLVILYALIVISTGVFIVYTQFFAPELISNLNDVQTQPVLKGEKRIDDRLLTDPAARLLLGESVDTDSGLQTFAPYEDYYEESSNGQKQIVGAAAGRTLEHSRISLAFGWNNWIRARKLLSLSEEEDKGVNIARKKRSSKCDDEVKVSELDTSTDTFPSDLFTLEQRRHGAILLHICGLFYMFVSLAIVCDDYFVPSLSVLSDVMKISDDVAGATFMAAGGSAPEFFTSLFGVFITSNNIGVGTIVGSATFNVLFVLSFCAIFSKKTLHLTWFPMFRDMAFYIVSLLFLLFFFMDEVVDWYEALVLFILYILYGIFMKYNATVEKAVKQKFSTMSASVGIYRNVLVERDEGQMTNGGPNGPFINKHLPIISTIRTIPIIHSGAIYRLGLVQLAMQPDVLANKEDSDAENRSITPLSVKLFSRRSPPLDEVHSTPSTSDPLPQICLTCASSRPELEEPNLFANDALTSSRTTSTIWSTSTALTSSKVNKIHPDNGDLAKRTRENSIPGLKSPMDMKRISVEIEPEKPIDMEWPSTFYKRCIYIILAPITFPLYFTLPDVKKHTGRKFFLWTFSGSIIWIAFYSYLMVWLANTIGETIGLLNSEIMGLTILAAGTSIPDLITSVIVARKGLGDMAVSSSIGSNLFDVCVGLPIPWLVYYGVGLFSRSPIQRISVESNGLICSVGMLFLMLLLLYGTVALFGWRLSKFVGFTMIISYCLFCALSILLEIDYLACPLKRIGC